MAGRGNPNHDPRNGRFTTAGMLSFFKPDREDEIEDAHNLRKAVENFKQANKDNMEKADRIKVEYDARNDTYHFSIGKAEIHALTGAPISPEYQEAMSKLENGQPITPDEYENIPEVKEARQKAPKDAEETIDMATVIYDGIEMPRKTMRQMIADKMSLSGSARHIMVDGKEKVVYDGEVATDKRADIVIGLPASGKSSAVVDPLSHKYKSKVIDSDDAKKMIPEFDDGWGAGRVHAESKEIVTDVEDNAMAKGENIVIPIVGAEEHKIKKRVNLLKAYGYDVHLHLNDLDPNKAAGRNLRRFASDGRFVDLQSTSFKYQNKPAQVYDTLKKWRKINGYSKVSNDVKFGEKPIQLEGTETISFDW